VIDRRAGPLQATEEITVSIDRGTPDNLYVVEAFFRGPGVAQDRRQLDQMLKSMVVG